MVSSRFMVCVLSLLPFIVGENPNTFTAAFPLKLPFVKKYEYPIFPIIVQQKTMKIINDIFVLFLYASVVISLHL